MTMDIDTLENIIRLAAKELDIHDKYTLMSRLYDIANDLDDEVTVYDEDLFR